MLSFQFIMENFDNFFDQSDVKWNGFLFEEREKTSQSPTPSTPPPPKPKPPAPELKSPTSTTTPPISPVFHPEKTTKFPFPPHPPNILKPSTSTHPSTPKTPLAFETQEITPRFPPTFPNESGIDPTQCFIPDSQPSSPSTQELFEAELSSK